MSHDITDIERSAGNRAGLSGCASRDTVQLSGNAPMETGPHAVDRRIRTADQAIDKICTSGKFLDAAAEAGRLAGEHHRANLEAVRQSNSRSNLIGMQIAKERDERLKQVKEYRLRKLRGLEASARDDWDEMPEDD